MPRLDDLQTALVNADKAGDTEAARILAAEIIRAQTPDPTEGMSGTEKFLAGAGKAFVDISRGVRQIVSPSDALQSEIDESKRLDAPLIDTGAGLTGNIAGNVAAAVPAAFIPGANTLTAATAIGGVLGAIQPTAEGESRLENTVVGAGSGAAGFGLAKAVGAGISAAKNKIANLVAERSANAARDTTLATARQAGFVVPPSEVNPGFVTNILEKWAGKAAVSQSASLKNQKITNKLVRESLGLPKDTPITTDTLEPIKQAAWSVYDKVKSLGTFTADSTYKTTLTKIGKSGQSKLTPSKEIVALSQRLRQNTLDAEDVVESIKTLRFEAKTNLSPFNTNPVSKRLGKAQLSAADALEGLIERNIQGAKLGKEVVESFRKARITLGKVGTVERAMIESTGDVSARKLAQELAKGKPLTGELKTAAKFAQAYPRANQLNVNPIPGGSPLDVAAAGVSVAAGNPGIGSLLLARPLARGVVMSPILQRQPNYSPLMSLAASKLPNLPPRTAQSLGILAPAISVSNR